MFSLEFVVRLVEKMTQGISEPSKLTKMKAEGFIEAVFHSHKETDVASFLKLPKIRLCLMGSYHTEVPGPGVAAFIG